MVNPGVMNGPVIILTSSTEVVDRCPRLNIHKNGRRALLDLSNKSSRPTQDDHGKGLRRSARIVLLQRKLDQSTKSYQINDSVKQGGCVDAGKAEVGIFDQNEDGANKNLTSHKRSSSDVTFFEDRSTLDTLPSTKRRRTRSISVTGDSIFCPSGAEQETNYNMVCSPFDSSKYTSGFSVHDVRNQGKVLQAPEYVADIFQRLFKDETKSRIYPYMHKQPELNATMRMIVVDWLVEVHSKFRLEPQTLHLCVSLLDRFLSVEVVKRSQLQLVAVTCLFLASKYEEIYPPMIKDCVYITDKAYTREEILDMESKILDKLKFKLSFPTGFPFMLRFLTLLRASPTMEIASQYYMDRALQEHDFLEYRPSLVAAAAVSLAVNNPEIRDHDELDDPPPGIPNLLLEYTGFNKDDIMQVAQLLADKLTEVVVTISKRELYAVKVKYGGSRYEYIATAFSPPDIEDLVDSGDRVFSPNP